MLGYDFEFFWHVGQAVVQGLGPYSVYRSVYPPAAAYLFAVFGLLPFTPAFALWTGCNGVLFLQSLKRLSPRKNRFFWFAYPPAIFIFLTGQLDILFLWFCTYLKDGGWKTALAAAGLTLKPQVALIALPYFLVQWLAKDRPTLYRFIAACLILHGFPLLLNPVVYTQWIHSLQGETHRILTSPGLFTLVVYGLPLWLLFIPAVLIILWGLRQNAFTSWAAMLFSLPVGVWYEDILLVEAAPWYFLVPLGWICFFLAALVQSSVPLAGIPLFTLLYRLTNRPAQQPPAAPADS